MFFCIAISVFFAILFLQSGLDKIIDWKGNYEFHSKHFSKSPLQKFALPMLILILCLEIICGLMAVTGIVLVLAKHDTSVAYYASCLAAVIFIALFFGQRVSKDYAGAAALVPYFILSLIGIYVAQPCC